MVEGDLKPLVRTISDFPKPGIQFRDITTLMADPEGFKGLVEWMVSVAAPLQADIIAGVEARGFILGGALAAALGAGFLPVRKKGKLPGKTVGIDYVLEYGTDRLEIHDGQIRPGSRVIMVDDLIATGGTALAAAQLLREQGASLVMAMFAIDLPDLGGMKALKNDGVACTALMAFDGH